jgi:predicted nucleic-acid-binding Zn-ribbon protein
LYNFTLSNECIKILEENYENKLKESSVLTYKLNKELKQTNKKLKLFEIENKEYKEIFSELSDYISVVRKTQEH